MLNSKQRAWLRRMANTMPSQFQIGKSEISPTVEQSLDEILATHELVKVAVMKSAETDIAEMAHSLAEAAGAEVVQVIGRRFILYRHSEKLARQGKAILLP